MTGRQVLAAIVAIVLATAVLPPAAAFAVNRHRVSVAENDVAALAARAAADPRRPAGKSVRCGAGRMPEAGSAATQAWLSASRDAAGVPDPWGNCYLLSARWVISAGPNGTIDTPFDADSTTGDDIGVPARTF